MALTQERLAVRVAEALPWVALEYWQGASTWLVEQARKLNLQNRLGFVVCLARQISERNPQNEQRTHALRDLEATLDESRLAKEDIFYRPPRTEGEKRVVATESSGRSSALEFADGFAAGTLTVWQLTSRNHFRHHGENS